MKLADFQLFSCQPINSVAINANIKKYKGKSNSWKVIFDHLTGTDYIGRQVKNSPWEAGT